MRKIQYIVIHCTATQPEATVESIQRYWKESLGWKSPGYHHIIKATGEVVDLLPIEQVSNGVEGYNSRCINISYVGGIDMLGKPKDTRTPQQKASLLKLVQKYKAMFPDALVQGHRDFPKVQKACPSFDAKTEYRYF
jgi:N-acetylmuramoyl-L-alanine amidase